MTPHVVLPEAGPDDDEPVDHRWDRADHHAALGEWSEAARALAGIVEQERWPAAARLLLAEAFLSSAQLRQAELQLRRLVAEHPADAYAQYLLGLTLRRQGRHDEAVRPLRRAGIR